MQNLEEADYVYNDHVFGYFGKAKADVNDIEESKNKKVFSFKKIDSETIPCRLPKLDYKGSREHKVSDLTGYSCYDKEGMLIDPSCAITKEIVTINDPIK